MNTATISQVRLGQSEISNNYKPSTYNHFVERGDAIWAVNFRSRKFIRLSREEFDRAIIILEHADKAGTLEPAASESRNLKALRDKLIQWHFLIPEELDEIALLKTRNRATRFCGTRGLTLVIAPTLRCNFGCDYCYVNRNAKKMATEARSRVAKFFDQKLLAGMTVKVVWTGGDPSLAMEVVEDLSLRFLESCEHKACTYEASLITNGYLLNDRMAVALKRSAIKVLQISLDGSLKHHNATRHLPNGKPTYDKILENVESICDHFKIYLRINVHAKNQHALPELMDDLVSRGLGDRVYIYFARVDDVNENSSDFHDTCLSPRGYAKLEASLIRLALDKGLRLGGQNFLDPTNVFCGANSANYYVIDPDANLSKCYHGLGAANQHRIGEISEDGKEVATNPYALLGWLSWDPFEREECRNCKILPLCMGGCSDKIFKSNMDIEQGCRSMRFSMDEVVDILGEAASKRVASTPGCADISATGDCAECGVPEVVASVPWRLPPVTNEAESSATL